MRLGEQHRVRAAQVATSVTCEDEQPLPLPAPAKVRPLKPLRHGDEIVGDTNVLGKSTTERDESNGL